MIGRQQGLRGTTFQARERSAGACALLGWDGTHPAVSRLARFTFSTPPCAHPSPPPQRVPAEHRLPPAALQGALPGRNGGQRGWALRRRPVACLTAAGAPAVALLRAVQRRSAVQEVALGLACPGESACVLTAPLPGRPPLPLNARRAGLMEKQAQASLARLNQMDRTLAHRRHDLNAQLAALAGRPGVHMDSPKGQASRGRGEGAGLRLRGGVALNPSSGCEPLWCLLLLPCAPAPTACPPVVALVSPADKPAPRSSSSPRPLLPLPRSCWSWRRGAATWAPAPA